MSLAKIWRQTIQWEEVGSVQRMSLRLGWSVTDSEPEGAIFEWACPPMRNFGRIIFVSL
jgi:hypothetical protein